MNNEKRFKIMERDNFRCQRCGKHIGTTGQIAHRIKSGKGTENYISKYVITNYSQFLKKNVIRDDIIDNPLNLVYTCSHACNDSFNIFNSPIERDGLLEKILKEVIK